MIGPEAGEVMSVVQMAMLAGFPYTALRDAILTHPTMTEGLNVLFPVAKPADKKPWQLPRACFLASISANAHTLLTTAVESSSKGTLVHADRKAGDGMSQAAVRAEKDALASPGTHRQILRNPPGTHCPTMI
jgi:hypothetical protein